MLTGAPVQGGVLLGTAPKGIVELRLDGQLVPVDADGRFLIAFDRDAQPQAWLTGRLADGTPLDRALAVAPRDWRIEQVNAPLRPPKRTEAFLAMRKPELERIGIGSESCREREGQYV